jgi:predicted RNA methylase
VKPEDIASTVRDALDRDDPILDATFDQVFPAALRGLSEIHWTPVAVAVRAARLLAPWDDTRVLDVGAGTGKLCLVGALTTRARWYGIEEAAPLVDAATAAARALGVESTTTFGRGDVGSLDWGLFDALYFFNPFASALEESDDDPIERWSRFGREVKETQERLLAVRPGTRVVTYHGLGGEVPDGYVRTAHERVGTGHLDLWIRSGPSGRW